MNGLHPCTLPQQAPFAAVRRVSPLCAAFCPDNECVCGVTEKAHVAPTCGQRGKSRIQNAEEPRRSGKNPPVREEPASHLASRRSTGSLPNASNRAEAHTHFNENGGNMRMGKKKTAFGHAEDDHEEMRMDTM